MFRDLARKNKQLPHEDCVRLLEAEKRGVLSVLGDDDYPYGMPRNHWYDPADGSVWFHCGRAGHRLDALRRHDRASFCVYDSGTATDSWALQVRSVIVFGRITVVDDPETVVAVSTALCHKFTQDAAYIDEEIRQYAVGTLLLHLIPEHICGKQVLEA